MAATFAAQLRTIAAKSTNELDLRARRDAHAESLIFERSVAVKQDWETLYQICIEGFQELCLLDARLLEFERNLFSPQAKDQDREQLNKAQNEALDIVIEHCLSMLGSRLMLRPGIRALEWLVRRFRIHIYNTSALLLTILPYHETPLFRNVLSIIPANRIIDDWKFLGPYHKTASNVPRHAIVYTATHNDGFFSKLNNYTLHACQSDAAYSGLLGFWSSIAVEAIVGRLNQAKSGRKEVQRQRTEDVLLKVLPILSDGLEINHCPEMTVACFTIAIVIASTRSLADPVIDSVMEAMANTLDYPEVDSNSVLVSLSILVAQKEEPVLSKGVLSALIKLDNFESRLTDLKTRCPVPKLATAICRGCLNGLKKRNSFSRLEFLHRFLPLVPLLGDSSATRECLVAVLSKLQQLESADGSEDAARVKLLSLLQMLNDSDEFSEAFSEVVVLGAEKGIDVEAILGSTVRQLEAPATIDQDAMEVDSPNELETETEELFKSLPEQILGVPSFLAGADPRCFDQLLQTLDTCTKKQERVQRFEGLPLWKSDSATSISYLSFLLRVGCGPSSPALRSLALNMLGRSLERQLDLDTQALLPYVCSLLADPAPTIRRAACTVLLAMERAAPTSLVEGEECQKIGAKDLYDDQSMSRVVWFPSSQLVKILKQVFLPVLEECASDASQISDVVRNALNGPSVTTSNTLKQASGEIKKSLRHSLFESLTSHAIVTPLLKVKIDIIRLLSGVQKVGTSKKSKVLGPVLQEWASISSIKASELVKVEGLKTSQVDATMVELIIAQDRDAMSRTLALLESVGAQSRDELVSAFFDRIALIWDEIPAEAQSPMSIYLFDLAFSSNAALSRGARAVFQHALLSTETLKAVLEHSSAGAVQLQSEGPPQKKRRTSSGRQKRLSVQFGTIISRLALALELVDNSKSEGRPELLPDLFDMLMILRRLKDQQQSESPYLLILCLSNILAILDRAIRSRRASVDMSPVRADLVTDCVRISENSQVQATALLVSAKLAILAPERMLHDIMPIFTFMGPKIFSKDDDHSINVINQALDQIVPPLISSLKRQNETNLIRAASSLLSSFTAAFDHIALPRRVAFYQRLLQKLGLDDFSFAVVAMLAARKAEDPSFRIFLDSLMAGFPPSTQLLTYRKLVGLVEDVFSDKPHNAEPLLQISSFSSPSDRLKTSLLLFSTAEQVLANKNLHQQITRIYKLEDEECKPVHEEFMVGLHQILASIRDHKADGEEINAAVLRCMAGLLQLVPLAELFEILPDLLQEMSETNKDLRSHALQILAAQLQVRPVRNIQTQTAAIKYLAQLETIIMSSDDLVLKQAAIVCIDRICEVYGRKDIDSVVSASSILAGGDGLGSSDRQIYIMSLLSLATMLDVMREAAVPIVLEAMPRAFDILEQNVQKGDTVVCEAVYSLLSAVASHVPFMISEQHLDLILELSAEAASSNELVAKSRIDTLLILAKKIDLDSLVSSLSNTWDRTVENDATAVVPILWMLSEAIDFNSKSSVVRSAEAISSFITKAMDLRRVQFSTRDEESYGDEDVTLVETKLNELIIKFIYKLNDTTFRPIFETWVDWAVKDPEVASTPDTAKVLRQTTLFNFLTHFFSGLKSIVTSYASYIISPANAILEQTSQLTTSTSSTLTPDFLNLYTSLFATLSASFTHDSEPTNFFSAPSHFHPLSSNLTSQLSLAHLKPIRPLINTHVLPALVSLATATLDSPAHHQSLNHNLCTLRHHAAPAVRLASIRAQLALSEDPNVGDEWVNNVVGTSSAGGSGGLGGGASETMIYVNEMLEDDDEEVEREVRRWVRLVRERVGEDVFET